MDEVKKVDTRDNLKVVTSNDFITAKGLSKLSLKARKLLCIAIAQCKKTDDSFYYFEVSPAELAKLYNINPNHVYETADAVSYTHLDVYKRQLQMMFRQNSCRHLSR